MNRVDLRCPSVWVGLLTAALGAMMVTQAWGSRFFVPGSGTTAMAFPLMVGLASLAVGLLLAARAALGIDPGQPIDWPDRPGGLRLGGVLLALAAYVALLDKIGFALSNVLLGVLVLKLVGRYRWWVTLLVPIGLAALATGAFETALGVSLPRATLLAPLWEGR